MSVADTTEEHVLCVEGFYAAVAVRRAAFGGEEVSS